MTDTPLDAAVRRRSDGRLGASDAAFGYLDDVRYAAGVMEVEFDSAHCDRERATIELVLSDAPDVVVQWTPYDGWSFRQSRGPQSYRVGAESDAAALMPDPDEVAGWLRVLAAGERAGHSERPAPLDPDDEALLARLITFGTGTDLHEP